VHAAKVKAPPRSSLPTSPICKAMDAYMARNSAEQLIYGTIAPDFARRLIDAGRLEESLVIIQRARAADEGKSFRASRYELDENNLP
jgi:hypothetical protein